MFMRFYTISNILIFAINHEYKILYFLNEIYNLYVFSSYYHYLYILLCFENTVEFQCTTEERNNTFFDKTSPKCCRYVKNLQLWYIYRIWNKFSFHTVFIFIIIFFFMKRVLWFYIHEHLARGYKTHNEKIHFRFFNQMLNKGINGPYRKTKSYCIWYFP